MAVHRIRDRHDCPNDDDEIEAEQRDGTGGDDDAEHPTDDEQQGTKHDLCPRQHGQHSRRQLRTGKAKCVEGVADSVTRLNLADARDEENDRGKHRAQRQTGQHGCHCATSSGDCRNRAQADAIRTIPDGPSWTSETDCSSSEASTGFSATTGVSTWPGTGPGAERSMVRTVRALNGVET